MNIHYLINPVAGRGVRAVETIEKIKKECSKNEKNTMYITKGNGDAEKYCSEISALPGEHRFIVCGGDGTLCEAINGIEGKENCSVAVIPIGTGNDFVRNFCKEEGDLENFFDIEKQSNGTDVLLDCLDVKIDGVGRKLSLNMLNTGFDSEVADKVNSMRDNKLVPPKVAYVSAIAQKFVSKPTVKANIEIDGEKLGCDERMIVAIGNGGYCGGGFNAAPKAHLSDGLIDVCMVRNVTRREFLKLVGAYKNGTFLDSAKTSKYFIYRQCKSIKVMFEKVRKVSFDGETENCGMIEVENRPLSVRFTLPEGIDILGLKKYVSELRREEMAQA